MIFTASARQLLRLGGRMARPQRASKEWEQPQAKWPDVVVASPHITTCCVAV